jgi:hypothetical protein
MAIAHREILRLRLQVWVPELVAVFAGGQTVPGTTLTGPDCVISVGCRAHLSLGGFYLAYL